MTDAGTVASAPPARTGPIRVLFVCTGNSVRSVFAEALLRHKADSRFEAFSAGTHPSGVHPMTLRVLGEAGVDITDLRSKSTAEYLDQSFDYVITLCDDARQVCPTFPGGHETLHWGYDDPSAVEGPEAVRLAAFRRTMTLIGERTNQFITVMRRAR